MSASRDGLSVKERKLIAGKAAGLSGAEAARRAGYSKKTARVIASETLAKPNVREAFLKAMEKAGITDERLSKVMDDGLQANKAIAPISGRDTQSGDVEFVDVPDHPTRHKFLETAVKVKGLNAPEKTEVTLKTPEDFLNDLDDADSEREGEPPETED